MNSLIDMSDEELSSYQASFMGQSEEENTDLRKSQLVKKLDKCEKLLQYAEKNVKDMRLNIDNGNEVFVQKQAVDAMRQLNTCHAYINTVTAHTASKLELLADEDAANIDFKELEENVLYIRFHELLPRRKYDDRREFKQKMMQRRRYQKTFTEYFKNHKYAVYDEKVVICFLHHYSAQHLVRDHDNIDTKLIIDLIASYIMIDDSAMYCAHFCDYMYDDEDYTEVYVIPSSKFKDYII